jgi:DNA-binding response OmpR family regulator
MDIEYTLLVACADELRLGGICHELRADGYRSEPARSRREAELKSRSLAPRLLVLAALDAPLEQLALLRGIRAGKGGLNPELAVIVLGEAGGELELVRCLDAGADDYLAPGASHLELRARIAAVIRRLAPRTRTAKRVGALALDPPGRSASYAGRPLELSRTEFELLNHLAADPGRVASKRELLRDVWGYRAEGRTRTVDAHCARLRRKLAAAGGDGLVATVRGLGYRLCATPAAGAAADGVAGSWRPPGGPRAA